MATGTVWHRRGHSLDEVLTALKATYRKMTHSARWRNARRDYGIVGSIKVYEISYGKAGWHPHMHLALLLRERPTSHCTAHDLAGVLRSMWKTSAPSKFAPSLKHGMQAHLVHGDVDKTAHYLTKPHHLFQLLDQPTPQVEALWRELETATYHSRSFEWSRSLAPLRAHLATLHASRKPSSALDPAAPSLAPGIG